jgi:polyhydroxyalkanoate synthesis repressor PhaR
MAYVIKRYSNRKLYDTQESRYVTLEEIEEMIRAGREISVVDAQTGEDLTSVTLTQIILENERNRRANLPSAFLHQLIKHGEAWQDFVQRTMRSSLEGFVSSQRDMERVFREWSARSGWGPVAGAATGEPKRDVNEARRDVNEARREVNEARRDVNEAKRDGGDADADKLRDEVSALRDRLRSLEERLQKRKADAK